MESHFFYISLHKKITNFILMFKIIACINEKRAIGKDGKLLSSKLHGKEIDPKAEYRVATINYLIEGNDGMPALKEGTNVIAPDDRSNNTRFLIMNYFKDHQARGVMVDSKVEGRIIEK